MKGSIKFLMIGFLLCQGCGQSNKAARENHSYNDKEKNHRVFQEELFNEDPSYKQMKHDFIESYDEIIQIDTTLFDSIIVSLRHYCLEDSNIVIASKYNWGGSGEEFITHDFVTELNIYTKQNHLYSRRIDKFFFRSLLDDPLLNFGVLLYPSIKSEGNDIIISHSVSIPLTDVGKSAILKVGIDGTEKISE